MEVFKAYDSPTLDAVGHFQCVGAAIDSIDCVVFDIFDSCKIVRLAAPVI